MSNFLFIKFDDSVKILEEKNNYDGYDMLVEVGSALGLWIGVSVIGIFDLLFEVLYGFIDNVMKRRK